MGLDALDLLPRRVPPIYTEGGANPDSVAEMAGYSSGTEMLEALIGVERVHREARDGGDKRSLRERAIETATDEEMMLFHSPEYIEFMRKVTPDNQQDFAKQL